MSVVNIIAANTSVLHKEPHRQLNLNSNPRATMADSGPAATRLDVAELEELASHFLKDSIADSTSTVYATGQLGYLFQLLQQVQLTTSPSYRATTTTVHG